jgi:HSP20 family protein
MAGVALRKTDSIVDQLERVHRQIAERAYQLFRDRGAAWGNAISDWFDAEQEIVWKPAVEVSEKDGTLTILAALAGVDPKDIQVELTPEDLVIRAETQHRHSEVEGQVHHCEFLAGRVFRSVHFPKPVDVTKSKAEYRNGLLTVTAPLVSTANARKLDIQAA